MCLLIWAVMAPVMAAALHLMRLRFHLACSLACSQCCNRARLHMGDVPLTGACAWAARQQTRFAKLPCQAELCNFFV